MIIFLVRSLPRRNENDVIPVRSADGGVRSEAYLEGMKTLFRLPRVQKICLRSEAYLEGMKTVRPVGDGANGG